MTIGVNIRSNAAIRFLENTAKQMPFIQATAINSTMILAQKEQRKQMKKRFNIKAGRERFADLNVKIKFANKRTLKGVVSNEPPANAFPVFEKHEEGGTITAHGGGRKAIPTSTVQPNRNKLPVRSKRPRRLQQAGKSFVLDLKNTKQFIVQLVGRGRSRSLAFLYQLKRSVDIKPRLEFRKTVSKVVFDNFEEEWSKAFKKVLG